MTTRFATQETDYGHVNVILKKIPIVFPFYIFFSCSFLFLFFRYLSRAKIFDCSTIGRCHRIVFRFFAHYTYVIHYIYYGLTHTHTHTLLQNTYSRAGINKNRRTAFTTGSEFNECERVDRTSAVCAVCRRRT